MLNTLRNRIILAFAVIILSATLLSSLGALWSSDHQLKGFLGEINAKQLKGLTGLVEVYYNLNGDLSTIKQRIRSERAAPGAAKEITEPDTTRQWRAAAAPYGFGTPEAVSAIMRLALQQDPHLSPRETLQHWFAARNFVYGHHTLTALTYDESMRYLLNIDFHIRRQGHDAQGSDEHGEGDSHNEREYNGEGEGEDESEEKHLSIPFYHWANGRLAGFIVTEGPETYSNESSAFASATFKKILYAALIALMLALGLGIWLANRINAPVKALTRAATLLAEHGATEHLKIHSEDELGQMSRAFNRMADAIAAQQQIRKRLIADVSHELNTPLSIIRLEARGMQDDMQSSEKAAERIQREIDHLQGLITDLELLAEVDQQTIALERESIPVLDFLSQVIMRWQTKALVRHIDCRFQHNALPETLLFDAKRMRQVLDNLLRNAFQHAESGDVIEVSAQMHAGRFMLSVRDTGHGIHSEDLANVFDRYYREGQSAEQRGEGRGLGLAIVKQLVELHGGTVGVESEMGRGSTFTVSIPV